MDENHVQFALCTDEFRRSRIHSPSSTGRSARWGSQLTLLERTSMVTVLAGVTRDMHGPGELLIDQTFMFAIWDDIIAKVQPLTDYLKYMYETKQMAIAGSFLSGHQ